MPEIEEKSDGPEVQAKTQAVLLEMVKDASFFNELEKKVAELRKAGVKEKNNFKGRHRRSRGDCHRRQNIFTQRVLRQEKYSRRECPRH
jgi:hypothetical protein